MAFLDHVLQPPSYGWKDDDGNLIKPDAGQIFKEFFTRLNVFGDIEKLASVFQLA